jgi:hypothetical protein
MRSHKGEPSNTPKIQKIFFLLVLKRFIVFLLWVIFIYGSSYACCGSRSLNQDPDPGPDFFVILDPNPDHVFDYKKINLIV